MRFPSSSRPQAQERRVGRLGGIAGVALVLMVIGLGIAWWLSQGTGTSSLSLEPDDATLEPAPESQAASALQGASLEQEGPQRQQVQATSEPPKGPLIGVDWQGAVTQSWTGQVLGSRSGRPIARAEVEARFAQGVLLAQTNDEGQFEFEAPPGQDCDLLVRAEGFAPRVRPRCVTGPSVTVLLIESSALFGKYVPVRPEDPGALVQPPERLTAQLFVPGAEQTSEPLAEQPLDAEGAFRFDDLEPGIYSVSVGPGIFAVAKDLALGPGQELEVSLATIEGRFPVGGQVLVAPEGKPLPGAQVEVRYHALGVPGVLERDARESYESGPDGKLEFWAAQGMRTRLRITAPWGGMVETGFLDPSDWRKGIPWKWTIDAPAQLAGMVVDAEGEGVPNVRVRMDRGGHERRSRQSPVFEDHAWADGMVRELRTDAEGRFDFGEVPARYRLTLVAEPVGLPPVEGMQDWTGIRRNLVLKPGESKQDLRLHLHCAGELRGMVQDHLQRPYEGVQVTLLDSLGAEILHARTGSEGAFVMRGFPAQPKGHMTLHFEVEERWLGSRRVRFPGRDAASAGESGELPLFVLEPTFTFDRALLAQGWVLDDEGYGIPGARVIFRHMTDRRKGRVSQVTDDRGAFALWRDWPQPGRVEVRVFKPGWALQGGNKLVMDLPVADPLLLRVIPKSTDAPATVRGEVLLIDSQEAVPRLRVEGLRGVFTTHGTRFQITGIAPGRYRPRLRTTGYEYVDLPRIDLSPGAVVDLGTLRVGRACDLTLVVRGAGRRALPKGSRLRLQYVSGPTDRPDLKGRRIALQASGRAAKGPRWRALGVPRGRWKLVVTAPGYRRFEKTLNLNRRRTTQEITLKKQPAGAGNSQGR